MFDAGANMQLKPDPMRAKLAPIDRTEASFVYDVRVEGGGIENRYKESVQEEEHVQEEEPVLDEEPDEGEPVQEELDEEDSAQNETAQEVADQ